MEKFVSTVKVGINQSCFNKVGHLLVCKQGKRGWEPQFFHTSFFMKTLGDYVYRGNMGAEKYKK
jgi:hypothetical protein